MVPDIVWASPRDFEDKMKTKKRQHYLSQEKVEKLFQKHVSGLRKIKGFVNVDIRATIRIADPNDPNRAIVLQSKHAV
jgi:hypothetical protein